MGGRLLELYSRGNGHNGFLIQVAKAPADENIIIIVNSDIAERYLDEFDARWQEATDPIAGEDVTCE